MKPEGVYLFLESLAADFDLLAVSLITMFDNDNSKAQTIKLVDIIKKIRMIDAKYKEWCSLLQMQFLQKTIKILKNNAIIILN